MADFEPPSFSLGLDLDFDLGADPDPQPQPQPSPRDDFDPTGKQAPQSSGTTSYYTIDDDDDDLLLPAKDIPRAQASNSSQRLKRLRRGPPDPEPAPALQERRPVELRCNVDDDDIEDFSSQEDQPNAEEPAATQHRSVCSSSKLSLHGFRTAKPVNHCQASKRKEDLKPQASASMETGGNKLVFPKLTVSPLRRFQLLDSDSDDPSVCEDAVPEANNKVDSSLKKRQSVHGQYSTGDEQKGTKASASSSQKEDLWKDFCSEKSFHIPTPALDEVCEEYFGSMKNKNEFQSMRGNENINNGECWHQNSHVSKTDEPKWDSAYPLPPAYRYFCHEDPRIQKLVRDRLRNFYPLGSMDSKGNNQPSGSVIDYMRQFGHGEGSNKQAVGKMNAKSSSSRGRKSLKNTKAEEVSQGNGGWMNPRECEAIPKDAGKRRIQAVGRSAGHWFTGQDGRKVYITKNGQELTGQIAYRHYRKESGAGVRKSKKKKKTTAKKR